MKLSSRSKHRHCLIFSFFGIFSSLSIFASINAGKTAWESGNLSQAEIEFQNVVNTDPTSVEANVLLALTQFALLPADANIQNEAYRFGYELSPVTTDLIQSTSNRRIEHLDASKWSFQPNGGFENGDAIKSGFSRFGWGSILTAELEGPGELSFWWKLEDPLSPRAQNYLSNYPLQPDAMGLFRINGQSLFWIYPTDDAGIQKIYLGSGTHQIQWEFHDPDNSDESHAALWLDQVSFTPALTKTVPVDPNSLQDGIDLGMNLTNDGSTGRPIHSNAKGHEFQDFLRETFIPKLKAIESKLALYSNSTQPEYISLSFGLPWLNDLEPREYRFDHADALYFRAFIQMFIGYIMVLDPHELGELPLLYFFQRRENDWETMETVFRNFSELLTRRTGSIADAAVIPLDTARNLFREADSLAKNRAFSVEKLYFFRPDSNSTTFFEELINTDEFIPKNVSVRDYTMTKSNGYSLNANSLFAESINIRNLLPTFAENKVILGGSSNNQTFPDPTFNGILSNYDDATLTEQLAEENGIWTFERWKNYPGNSDSLEEYIFPLSKIQNNYLSFSARKSGTNQISIHASTEQRFGVSDYQFKPEFSTDLVNWIDEPDPIQDYHIYSYGSRIELGHNTTFANFKNIFMRLKAVQQTWPNDFAGWKIVISPGIYPSTEPIEFRFKENATLELYDVESETIKGTYSVQYSGHGKSINIHFFTENQIEHSITLELPYYNYYYFYGYGQYKWMFNPKDINETTQWDFIDENSFINRFQGKAYLFSNNVDFENKQINYIQSL